MTIELNIGLDISGQDSTEVQYTNRASFALFQLRGLVYHSQRFVSQYQGPDGVIIEHGLFVALNTNNMLAVRADVYSLSNRMNQDCIGVYSPTLDRGDLVGPQSEKWGPFQQALFKRFVAQSERMAA